MWILLVDHAAYDLGLNTRFDEEWMVVVLAMFKHVNYPWLLSSDAELWLTEASVYIGLVPSASGRNLVMFDLVASDKFG